MQLPHSHRLFRFLPMSLKQGKDNEQGPPDTGTDRQARIPHELDTQTVFKRIVIDEIGPRGRGQFDSSAGQVYLIACNPNFSE